MAESSLSKYLNLINQQIISQEHLSEFLSQVIAMLDVALMEDFSAFDRFTVYHYLLAMDDIVIKTRNFNEQLLSNWNTIVKLLEEPESQEQEPPSGETVH